MEKICNNCNYTKDISEFHKSKKNKYGVKSKCKICTLENEKIYYEKIKESKEYKEKKKQRAAEYYIKNKLYINEKNRRWQQENKEKTKERTRRWKERHPYAARSITSKYRNRKNDNSTEEEVSFSLILDRDGRWCYLCKKEIKKGEKLEFDHIVPLFKNGMHSNENISPTHMSCNRRKGHKLLSELSWYKY